MPDSGMEQSCAVPCMKSQTVCCNVGWLMRWAVLQSVMDCIESGEAYCVMGCFSAR